MAINNLDILTRLKQQLGYYGAGGGRPSEGQQLGQALTDTGQGLNAINTGVQLGQKTQEGSMMLKNLANQMAPVGKYQDPNAPLGVSPNTPTNVVPSVEGLGYKSAFMNNMAGQNVYSNPSDPADISPTPDVTHTIKTKSQYALANELKSQAQEALNALNDAKIKETESKDAETKLHYQRLADLQEERNKILTERINAIQAKTVQAASTKATSDRNTWGGKIRSALGIQSAPSEYLNSAAPQSAPQAGGSDLLNSLIQKHAQ